MGGKVKPKFIFFNTTNSTKIFNRVALLGIQGEVYETRRSDLYHCVGVMPDPDHPY
jgi:hypothetical protein